MCARRHIVYRQTEREQAQVRAVSDASSGRHSERMEVGAGPDSEREEVLEQGRSDKE